MSDYEELCADLRDYQNPDRDMKCDGAADAIDELSAEIRKLRVAVNDAIRRPKGVVPGSAAKFYRPDSINQKLEHQT